MKRLIPLLVLAAAFFGAGIACADIHVIGGLSRTKRVQPGDAFEGAILIKNTGAKPAQVRVHQSDYTFAADGTNDYAEPGTKPRSNAGWISVTPNHLTIGPRETASVRYSCRVPAKGKLDGTWWSMIMVEPNTPEGPLAKGGDQQVAVGVKTLIRFGVQIITEFGTTGTKDIRILDKAIVSKDERRHFQLDVENTGTRALAPTVSLELYSTEGTSLGRFDGKRVRLFPACSSRFSLDIGDVPPGKYVAMVLVDSGDESVQGAQYDLEIQP